VLEVRLELEVALLASTLEVRLLVVSDGAELELEERGVNRHDERAIGTRATKKRRKDRFFMDDYFNERPSSPPLE
jgi:hypothetical protein